MVVKIENIARGDLVEVALTPDAFKTKNDFIYPNEDVNEPGRKDVGYVSLIKDESVFLASEWDSVRNRGARILGEYSFKAIESWRKL